MNKEIKIPINKIFLEGILDIPDEARKLILFAHGSGSSRFSPRNQFVARVLREKGLGTLLFDLLTKKEEEVDELTGEYRFDIKLLAERLVKVTDWLREDKDLKDLKIGYFGASTGAAAALLAAAEKPTDIFAIVSRGGRPDLAEEKLDKVLVPTLLIVGGNDFGVIELNQKALENIKAEKELKLVSGATHLFEEPGALEEVAKLSAEWFLEHVAPRK